MSFEELLQKTNIRSIASVRLKEVVNIVGVITDFKPVSRSQRGKQDYCRNLVIKDSSGYFIPVNLFKDSVDKLPQGVKNGNIILIKGLVIVDYRRAKQGNSSQLTTFTTFATDNQTLQEVKSPGVHCPFTKDDLCVVRHVLDFARSQGLLNESKFIKTCDIESTQQAFKYIGMVTTLHSPQRTRIDINLIDYTKNPRPHPASRSVHPEMAINCTLWDNHALNCPALEPGDFVMLEHLVKKVIYNVLTVNMHRSQPQDCFVHKLQPDDPRLSELLERKRMCEGGEKRKRAEEHTQVQPVNQRLELLTQVNQGKEQRPKAHSTNQRSDQHTQIQSVNQKLGPNTQALLVNQRTEHPSEAQPVNYSTQQHTQVRPVSQRAQVQSTNQREQAKPTNQRTEPHTQVRSVTQASILPSPMTTTIIHSEVRGLGERCSLDKILEKQLDGIEPNASYLTKAIVKDYKPKPINDWVQHWCGTCYKTYKAQPTMNCEICKGKVEYIFQFVFLLESEGLNALAYGFKEDCCTLFGNILPKDVYDNPFKREELQTMIENICNKELDIGLKAYITFEGMLNFRIVNTKYTMTIA